MKHEDEILDQLLHSKSFADLTAVEKEFVIAALGSEEEFTALKRMDEWLERSDRSQLQPGRRVLPSLIAKMRERNMPLSIWQRVLQVKVPAYVALLILIFVTSTIFFLRPEPIERTIAGPAILKIDTVYVTKRDTVFRDKVIYTLVRTPEAGNKRQAEVIPAVIPVGVSMKEKDELNKLLVSGSD